MKKALIVLICLVSIGGIALWETFPYITMEFESSARYSEHDKREYDYYTPDLFKKIPIISKNYEFHFSRISGTEANVFTVWFYDTVDIQSIKNYLKSEGYQKKASCDVEAECWQNGATNDVVTVANFLSEKEVLVQMYQPLYPSPMNQQE